MVHAGQAEVVVIEAALNGARSRAEQPAVPETPAEVAAEARRCADAGATIFHVHARDAAGGWSADPVWYADTHRRVRAAVPNAILSVTSIRPAEVPVETVLGLLASLAADRATRPDLVSVNLGHIVVWEAAPTGTRTRRTVHFPNDYEDVAALLDACAVHGVVPELGVMDLGFVGNAVALRDDGRLAARPWFLVELDSPAHGAGPQVAPSTTANNDALVAPLRDHLPEATWAAHGQGVPGFAVLRHALAAGAHVRVGFEDSARMPNGDVAGSNADLVARAAAAAREVGRGPATAEETRALLDLRG